MTEQTYIDKRIKDIEISKCTQVGANYTRDYVKGLEEELNKLIKENIYLKSDEYVNKILIKKKITDNTRENESLNRKIKFLTLLVQQLAYGLVNREDILSTLKAILDGNFYEILDKDNTFINK